jgi:hypothetical protein
MSVNQFVATAVAEKLALKTDFFPGVALDQILPPLTG